MKLRDLPDGRHTVTMDINVFEDPYRGRGFSIETEDGSTVTTMGDGAVRDVISKPPPEPPVGSYVHRGDINSTLVRVSDGWQHIMLSGRPVTGLGRYSWKQLYDEGFRHVELTPVVHEDSW